MVTVSVNSTYNGNPVTVTFDISNIVITPGSTPNPTPTGGGLDIVKTVLVAGGAWLLLK